MTTEAKQQRRVVVIGAGYAGLMATVRLARKLRGDANITLVNGMTHFVERLRLHQIAANQDIPRYEIAAILRNTGVKFMHAWVKAVHADQQAIRVQNAAGEEELHYDYLLYALGSNIDRESIAGVCDHAYTLSPAGALSVTALQEALPALNDRGGKLLICGGGATGIEAAAEFAESFPKINIQLVTRGVFGSFTQPKVAAYLRAALYRLGVKITDRTTVTAVRAGEALTAAGAILPYDVCLWTGGFSAPSTAREAGIAVNDLGQILIDPYMRSISHPTIYAVGDAAHPVEEPGVPIRMSAFTALVTGAHGAHCLSDIMRGISPQPLSFAYYGQAIALGRHDAIGFITYPADKPVQPYFTGRCGYLFREFFATFAGALPRLDRRVPGIFNWQGKGRYAAAKRRQQRIARAVSYSKK